jgi:calcineurin-like phosphoesterase family protein
VKLLLIADLHLGSQHRAWGAQAEAARRELARAWEEAVDLVVSPEEAIDGVLVAGDLFHTPEPEPAVLEPVSRGLERLAAAGKHAVLLPGIYDGLASPRSLYRRHTWPDSVTVVDWCRPRVVSLRLGGETLHLSTFAPIPSSGPVAYAPLPGSFPAGGYRVGLFHAVTRSESPLAPWGPRLSPEQLSDLGLQLVVLGGDLHFREALWSGTVMVTPGALVPSRPRDAEDSAWTLATLSASGIKIERRLRTLGLTPEPGNAAFGAAAGAQTRPAGGLRGAFLRIYENRREESGDRELLEAALRYGLEELDRLEAPRVD